MIEAAEDPPTVMGLSMSLLRTTLGPDFDLADTRGLEVALRLPPEIEIVAVRLGTGFDVVHLELFSWHDDRWPLPSGPVVAVYEVDEDGGEPYLTRFEPVAWLPPCE